MQIGLLNVNYLQTSHLPFCFPRKLWGLPDPFVLETREIRKQPWGRVKAMELPKECKSYWTSAENIHMCSPSALTLKNTNQTKKAMLDTSHQQAQLLSLRLTDPHSWSKTSIISRPSVSPVTWFFRTTVRVKTSPPPRPRPPKECRHLTSSERTPQCPGPQTPLGTWSLVIICIGHQTQVQKPELKARSRLWLLTPQHHRSPHSQLLNQPVPFPSTQHVSAAAKTSRF